MDITLAPRISRETAGSGTSQLWAQMLALCKTEGVMDLGQGAPNFHGSLVARQARCLLSFRLQLDVILTIVLNRSLLSWSSTMPRGRPISTRPSAVIRR
jgi:hypothetical protein